MDGLKGKVIIVTGAASGIGLATATTLLSSGVKVFGVDISASPVSLSSKFASEFVFHKCDVTQPFAASELVAACAKAFGNRIDGLLNIAGIMDRNTCVDSLEEKEWNRVIAVNLTAPVFLMKEVVSFMLRTGTAGTIANVCSKAGMSGAVAGVAYTASKHGLVGATKNTAWRYGDEGIRCNAICPGGVATNITSSIDMSKMDMGSTAKMTYVAIQQF